MSLPFGRIFTHFFKETFMSESVVLDQSVQEKFNRTREELSNALVERDQEIDLLLSSLICRENPLLIGPPGTGKSMLVDALLNWMQGTKFSILFSKFSMPEEIFGPVSLNGLKNDKFIRITEGKLPCADIAFGDEIFNASSGILNTLLKILNERVYEQGDGSKIKVPLKLFVGAANQ
jgi:MoxR-like ATPase